jgi:lactoylglutathione lyase
MITRIDHAAIYVSDLERSARWYRDALEVPLAFLGDLGDGEMAAFLDVGDTILALFQNRDPSRNLAEQHVAFAVLDVDAVWQQLKAKGVLFDWEPPINLPSGYVPGQRYIDFRDPDGVRLELVQRPPGWRQDRLPRMP